MHHSGAMIHLTKSFYFCTFNLHYEVLIHNPGLIWGLILIGQLVLFKDYISPFQWGRIKVSGLACTCPDESVISGKIYLKSITPDSLKNYNLNYSEIFVTERLSTNIDLMGADLYMISGKVIGKRRVSEYDPWNPVVLVNEWKEIDMLKDRGMKALIIVQILGLAIMIKLNRK